MQRKQMLVAGLLAAVVVLAGCSGGGGSTTTDAGTTETVATAGPTTTVTDAPTSTDAPTTAMTTETETPTPTPTPMGPQEVVFNVSVDSVTECGQTCRDVEYTIANEGGIEATDVTTRMVITSGGDEIYNETIDTGTIEATGDQTQTERVQLSQSAAFTVNANGGDVTIDLTPTSGNVSETFTFERNVG